MYVKCVACCNTNTVRINEAEFHGNLTNLLHWRTRRVVRGIWDRGRCIELRRPSCAWKKKQENSHLKATTR